MVSPRIRPGCYVPQYQQWRPCAARPAPLDTVSGFTVATLNVWFGDHYFSERSAAILALLAAHLPDVIALQEVTPAMLAQIHATPWIQEAYSLSDVAGTSVDPYGTLLLSRLPICDWQCVALPSALGRHLLTARTVLNGQPVVFANVHFESRLSAAPTRAEQVERVFGLLKTEPHVILMGDFNFCARWDENRQLDPAYQDLWPVLHPTDPGFTEDTDRNRMRLLVTGQEKQVRFDRILLRSSTPGWRGATIRLIGTEPISPGTPDIFPSDHFGLLNRLVWKPSSPEE